MSESEKDIWVEDEGETKNNCKVIYIYANRVNKFIQMRIFGIYFSYYYYFL